MRTTKRAATILFLIALLAQGCGMMGTRGYEPPYGESAATYSGGALQATYPNTVFRTHDAAREALRDFNATVTAARKDATGGILDARMPDGTLVAIDMQAKKPDITAVAIKVGTYGSEEVSRSISRRIEANLQRR